MFPRRLMIPKRYNRETGRMGSAREAGLEKQKIRCELCEDPSVSLKRYNEHYKARHDQEFVGAGRQVTQVLTKKKRSKRLARFS